MRFEWTSIVLAVVVTAHLVLSGSLIPVASENIRMAAAFSIDESDILFQIQHLYRAGIAAPPSFTYGGMLYYPATLLLHAWGLVGEVDGHAVVMALRWMCALAGSACLVLTFLLGRALFDRVTGLIAALILAVSPEFLRWSVEGHPDLPQLAWILLALWFCCRRTPVSLRGAAAAACCAGLAFGTKYGGAFLMPVVVLAAALPGADEPFVKGFVRRLGQRATWARVGLAVTTFVGSFAATNPWSIIRFEQFLGVMADYRAWMQFGHEFREAGSWVTWWRILYDAVGPGHAVALAGVAAAGVLALRAGTAVRRDRALLAAWVALFFVYLMVQVDMRRPRHLLPILPGLVLFAAWGYRALSTRVLRGSPATAAAVAFGLLLSYGQVGASVEFYRGRIDAPRKRADDLDVGRWLDTSVSPATTIVYDAYAYIPPAFQRVWRSTGTTYLMVSHFQPDLVIVRKGAADTYADPEAGADARIGTEAYGDAHAFYHYIGTGGFPDYALYRRFGSLQVYRRTRPALERTVGWKELATLYQQGKLYDVGRALTTLSEVYEADGRRADAARARERAAATRSDAMAMYERALELLDEGRPEEAREIWQEVLLGMAGRPAADLAQLRHHMARQFADAGYTGLAADEAEGALRADPTLGAAAFDLGTYRLLAGNEAGARAAYAAAVERFEVPDETAAQLEALAGTNPAAARMLSLIRGVRGDDR